MTDKTYEKSMINGLWIITSSNTAINKAFESLARLGYAARGVIYFVIGLLAVLLAFGFRGKTTDQKGAISMIGTQPAGQILLWLVLIGLVCYSLWELIQAIFNPFRQGHDAKGYALRIGYLVSAIAYAFLVMPTYQLIAGGVQPAQTGVQQGQIQLYTARILVMPLGQLVVGIIGIVVIIVGLILFLQGFNSGFERQIQLTRLDPVQLSRVRCLGRFGTIARGIVFALIGLFIVVAAYTGNSQQVKGFDSTITTILQQPYGRWLTGAIALGFICWGVYSWCLSIFFRLKK